MSLTSKSVGSDLTLSGTVKCLRALVFLLSHQVHLLPSNGWWQNKRDCWVFITSSNKSSQQIITALVSPYQATGWELGYYDNTGGCHMRRILKSGNTNPVRKTCSIFMSWRETLREIQESKHKCHLFWKENSISFSTVAHCITILFMRYEETLSTLLSVYMYKRSLVH